MGAGQFFGELLIIAGALIAALCGLCTVVFIGASVASPSGGHELSSDGMIPLALLLGGVPTVFGGLMIWAGIALTRSSRKTPPPVKPETFD